MDAAIKRDTKETGIRITLDVGGTGRASSNTGVKFIDHLIESFAKHGMMDLDVQATSKDGITHHLIEDTAIALGQAIDQALNQRRKIARYGSACVPMDESLAEASIDLVKRSYYKLKLSIKHNIEDVTREDLEHFFQSLLQNMNCCVHLTVRYGENDHHKAEAAIKALAVAFREAASSDEKQDMPSTKGSMR